MQKINGAHGLMRRWRILYAQSSSVTISSSLLPISLLRLSKSVVSSGKCGYSENNGNDQTKSHKSFLANLILMITETSMDMGELQQPTVTLAKLVKLAQLVKK